MRVGFSSCEHNKGAALLLLHVLDQQNKHLKKALTICLGHVHKLRKWRIFSASRRCNCQAQMFSRRLTSHGPKLWCATVISPAQSSPPSPLQCLVFHPARHDLPANAVLADKRMCADNADTALAELTEEVYRRVGPHSILVLQTLQDCAWHVLS